MRRMPIRRGDHRSVPYSVEKIGLLDSLGSNTSRAEISAKRPSPHPYRTSYRDDSLGVVRSE